MKVKAHCVIMAGGSGTRFWPLSRKDRPKQLLNLAGNKTLLRGSVERALGIFDQDKVHIVSGKVLESSTKKDLSKYKRLNYVFEPKGRNTAPCIGYMAMKIALSSSYDDVLVIMPADHLIKDETAFLKIINAGIKACTENNELVTIGIKPTSPHTGYGYIKTGNKSTAYNGIKTFKVSAFKEKPNLKDARRFIKDGTYLWNAGIFIAQAGFLMKAIKKNMPALYKGLERMSASIGTKNELSTFNKIFPTLPAESIDYGVIEKLPSPMVIPASFGWNDLGNWNSLEEILDPKDFGISNSEKIININSSNNIIHASDKNKVIALLDVKDLIIVETEDALLIADKNNSQKIRDVVEKIKQKGLEKHV